MRIYKTALARKYGSRAVVQVMSDLGFAVKSPSSVMPEIGPLFTQSIDRLLNVRSGVV